MKSRSMSSMDIPLWSWSGSLNELRGMLLGFIVERTKHVKADVDPIGL